MKSFFLTCLNVVVWTLVAGLAVVSGLKLAGLDVTSKPCPCAQAGKCTCCPKCGCNCKDCGCKSSPAKK